MESKNRYIWQQWIVKKRFPKPERGLLCNDICDGGILEITKTVSLSQLSGNSL